MVKVLFLGRVFCCCVYVVLVGGKKFFYFIRILKEIRLDLEMWVEFFIKFNGLIFFLFLIW